PSLWLAFFATTALMYLVQTRAEAATAGGPWPLLAGWLHTSALPVFAVLAVVTALLWGAVQRWLADYELFAERAAARAKQLVPLPSPLVGRPHARASPPPRRPFGLSSERRPPPLPA